MMFLIEDKYKKMESDIFVIISFLNFMSKSGYYQSKV